MKVKDAPPPSTRIKMKTRPDLPDRNGYKWWETRDSNKAAAEMIATVSFIKKNQGHRFTEAATFARLYGNRSLYSIPSNVSAPAARGSNPARPTFNLIQSATDTLISKISQSKPQPVFLTDNGDYKQRSLAKKLDQFIQGEFYRTKAYEKGTMALRDACVEGTGILHVYETPGEKVGIERVLLTELFVDANEAIYGEPRRFYRIKLVDRNTLIAAFPKLKSKIGSTEAGFPDSSFNASQTVSDLVMVVEAWSLPSGDKTGDGRHMLACSAGDLIDEEWTRDRFPFSFIHYSQGLTGFWGQGLAEQLMGTQIELNNILYTISKAIKLAGVPRVFVEEGSKVNSASHNNDIGVIVKFQGTKPSYEVAPCNAPELYAERDKLIQYGYQQCGVSSLQATSQKPAGLDSGKALRTYDNITTDRFATLNRNYDNVFIDLAYLIVDQAKEIAERDGKYSSIYPNKNGIKEIDLPKADLLEDTFVVQCYTQSSLPKDPAGRMAQVTEMIQAGMVSIQEGRRLLNYPDLEQMEKLDSAGEERIFQILDDMIETGKYVMPDPFMDLDLAERLTTQYINLYGQAKLEESKLDKLRQFFSQVQDIKMNAMPPPPLPGAVAPNTPQALPAPLPQSPLVPNAV